MRSAKPKKESQSDILPDCIQFLTESADMTTSVLHRLARDATMQICPNGHPPEIKKVKDQLLQSQSEFSMAEELGAGGMGRIFRAHQKDLQRDVAIKQLHPHLSEVSRIREGFFNEAIITGKLAHPNVVPVYALSQSPNNLSMSMKLISGCTLEDIICPETRQHHCMAKKFDADDCIEIIIAICNPVAFAHSQQIIHRDIKPGNIMVGEFGEILLLDWGLACSVADDADSVLSAGIPHVSGIPGPEGTLSYMAPEMLENDGRGLGTHSDIYLLGACLYFVLTGTPPHRHRHNKVYATREERDAYEPLPDHVDAELKRICDRAMAPHPADRYSTAQEFQADLKGYLKHQESRQVANDARIQFEKAKASYGPNLDSTERISLFHDLSECLASYRQALSLWEGNTEAKLAHQEASLAAARMMYESEEYKGAMVYMKDLEGPEADEMRKKIRCALDNFSKAKRAMVYLRVTALVLGGLLVASGISAWMVYHFMEKTAEEVADETRKSLVADGKRDLGRVVSNTAIAMGYQRQTIATALNQFVVRYREAYQKQVQQPDSVLSETEMTPASADNSFKVYLPEGTSKDTVFRELNALTEVGPQIEQLYKDNKAFLIRYYIGLEKSNILAEFPGASNQVDISNITETGWFQRGKFTNSVYYTPPYRENRSGRVVTSAVLPVVASDNSFLGVAGVDIYMSDILKTLKLASNWKGGCKIEIARIIDNAVDIVFSTDYEKMATKPTTNASWVPRERIADIDPNLLAEMKHNLQSGKEGVMNLKNKGRAVLWGYAPLGIQEAFVLITVDHTSLTREADETRDAIISSNTNALIHLGKRVGLIFGALLVLSAILAFPLVRRRLENVHPSGSS